jgi:hypothetical protein
MGHKRVKVMRFNQPMSKNVQKEIREYENVTQQKDARSCSPMTCCQASETLPTITNLISTLVVNLGK